MGIKKSILFLLDKPGHPQHDDKTKRYSRQQRRGGSQRKRRHRYIKSARKSNYRVTVHYGRIKITHFFMQGFCRFGTQSVSVNVLTPIFPRGCGRINRTIQVLVAFQLDQTVPHFSGVQIEHVLCAFALFKHFKIQTTPVFLRH